MMEEEKNNQNKEKQTFITINNKEDLDFWCEKLRCNKEDLVEAVIKVGGSYTAINNYLTMNNKTKVT